MRMRFTLLPTTLLPFLILATATPTFVLAQSNEALAELVACLDVEQDQARLACLEAIVVRESIPAEPSSAPASVAPLSQPASPTVPAASTARPVSEPAARGDSGRTAVDEEGGPRYVMIVDAHELARGNMRFITDDGEVFVQIYGPRGSRYPPVPFSAEIAVAAMGSFFLRAEGGPRGVRVRRAND
ncbi:MAG: hypothetical protein OEN48_17850 [Betaproteobacteria bacterium]|nr:hypothetical protein [Betaproteobacteria bacterium]